MASSIFHELIAQGFNVMPVLTDGTPAVKVKNKTTGDPLEYTLKDADGWATRFESTGAALLCGVNNVVAIDFDITNVKLAGAMRRALLKRWPDLIVRDCNPPKFAIVVQVDASMDKYGNGWANQYTDGDGATQWIELVGWLKSITLYGKHRKTSNPYSWTGDKNPCKTQASSLPILSLSDIEWVFDTFAQTITHNYPDWHKVRAQRIAPKRLQAQTTGLAGAKPTRSYTDAEVYTLIDQHSGELRDGWMAAGRALHAHFKGKMEGLEFWDQWSKRWDSYEAGECAKQWSHFRVDGGTTMGSIAHGVRTEKKAPANLLDAFLKRFVFVSSGSRVGDLDAHSNEGLLPLVDMRNQFANAQIATVDAKGNPRMEPALKMWMADPDRVTVHGETFAPGKGRVCSHIDADRDKKYWNTYTEPQWGTSTVDAAHVKIFTDHIQYLFGAEEGGAEWFTNWLAHMIQQPWDRADVAPIHISTVPGTGRGWLSSLMLLLVGRTNTSETSISKMCNEGGKNGYLHNSILCLVPEVREQGASRFSVSESVKKQITDHYINVDLKYGAEGLLRIYTRFFFQSNHVDAMVIDEGDRRFNVFANHAPVKSPDYYKMLTASIEDTGFIASVYGFLMAYKFNAALLRTVLPTRARKEMMLRTKSHTALAFLEFKRHAGVFTHAMVLEFLASYSDTHGTQAYNSTNSKELGHLIREYARHTKQGFTLTSTGKKRSAQVMSFLPEFIDDDVTEALATTNERITTYFNEWR